MDGPVLEDDPRPDEIDPRIVDIFRENPTLQQYMAMYLSGQVSWRETLEHSLIHVHEQYVGAIVMAAQNLKNKEQCRTKLLQQSIISESVP